jgi:hypothetical protein
MHILLFLDTCIHNSLLVSHHHPYCLNPFTDMFQDLHAVIALKVSVILEV